MGDGHTGECHLIIPFFSEDWLQWLSCIIHLKRYPDILTCGILQEKVFGLVSIVTNFLS